MLQAQSSRELNLKQTCHEIAEKSSKIVPLGAPYLIFRSMEDEAGRIWCLPRQKLQSHRRVTGITDFLRASG
jgi:hypothetical protein